MLAVLSACSGIDCNKIPTSYSNYDDAVKTIKSASFSLSEFANTSISTWIKGASYYSCDGLTGYFLLESKNSYYLYSNMPLEIWNEFKNAKSKGNYYNQYIKGNYRFNLSK